MPPPDPVGHGCWQLKVTVTVWRVMPTGSIPMKYVKVKVAVAEQVPPTQLHWVLPTVWLQPG